MNTVALLILASVVGASSGYVSRRSVIAIKDAKIKKLVKSWDEKFAKLEAANEAKQYEMQLFIDGLKEQITYERMLNAEYERDVKTFSESLAAERKLSETLNSALLLQEPKVKRQHDAFREAVKMHSEVRQNYV